MKIMFSLLALISLVFLQFSGNIVRYFRKGLSNQRGSSQTEGDYLGDVLKLEAANNYSRETVTIESGQDLTLGAILGRRELGTCPTTGTAGSNTGGGTCTSVTAGSKAKVGIYTLKCIIKQSGAGIFSVEDPDGYALPNAVVAAAYTNDQINFIINDGTPDFEVGDIFTVTIAEGSLKCVELDLDAVDGSQNAYGMLIADCDATTADTSAVAIIRDAIVIEDNLVWPSMSPAISDAQIATAMAQLLAKGIDTADEA
jgi:hypothetical protein